MTLIFRIAAGIVIGYLLLMIINIKTYEYTAQRQANMYENSQRHSGSISDIQRLRGQTIGAINSYVTQHHKLPNYVADIYCGNQQSCDLRFVNMVQHSGTFYTSSSGVLVGIAPTQDINGIHYDCRFNTLDGELRDSISNCSFDAALIKPISISPSFDCNVGGYNARSIVCASDKLTDLDLRIDDVYTKLIGRGLLDDIDKVKQSQQSFIRGRNNCFDHQCIERMSIARLQELHLAEKFGVE